MISSVKIRRIFAPHRYIPTRPRRISTQNTNALSRPPQLTSLPLTISQILRIPPSPTSSTNDGGGERVKVTVNGWIDSIRKQKNVSFASIGDGSCARSIQAVIPRSLPIDLERMNRGAGVRVVGEWVRSEGRGQSEELRVEAVDILGDCPPEDYPIQKKKLSTEYLRDHAHLRTRYSKMNAMLRMRDRVTCAVHHYFHSTEFLHMHTPIITSNDCEGGGETFRLTTLPPSPSPSPPSPEFFSKPAHLTVSHQLHLEALSSSYTRLYTLSPSFRAEKSQTSRHLAEFYMLEAEMSFVQDLGGVMDVLEGVVKSVLGVVVGGEDWRVLWEGRERELASFEERGLGVGGLGGGRGRWPRVTYDDVLGMLDKAKEGGAKFEFPTKWGDPLKSEHEKYIAEEIFKGPVFVTDYPAHQKPFYMATSSPSHSSSSSSSASPSSSSGTSSASSVSSQNADRTTAKCFDLLVPHSLELAGGSLRLHTHSSLLSSLSSHNLSPEEFGWYLDLRKWGSVPHGGFGMGFDRLMGWIGGVGVRECVGMPRWAGRMLL
ncbi:asparaginyl-tRNA synthetase [Sistotremastrum suecicum HHB10207 ss-3]|uniref:Asparaginyl-tRNA synthetase n=1 Tax=Sistotremastrum suecicum HHB10207 ss-3 TaxID=1314776 RepID=A0A166GCS9_9AGAM|nr:asparaginyl-tRNA synthetase [Sistotremastrum suecicum HHB10207 ss-3]